MTIVVEDGTGLANANSYMSEADITTALTGTSSAAAWAALSSGAKEAAVRATTVYLDSRFRFYGNTMTAVQALQWPRSKNLDEKGVVIPKGTIPNQLKQGFIRILVAYLEDPENLAVEVDGSGSVKSWSADGLSLAFDVGAKSDDGMGGYGYLLGNRYPDVEFLLRSIGTLKDVSWLQADKSSIVRP